MAPDRHGILLTGTWGAVGPRLLLAGPLAAAGLLGLAALADAPWVQLFGNPPAGPDAALTSPGEPPAALPAAEATLPHPPSMPKPAISRWALQGDAGGQGLTQADRDRLRVWVDYLSANPAQRVQLTLDNCPGADGMPAARRLAYLLRFLAAGGIDPHRVQLLLLPPADPPLPPDQAPILEIGTPT